jgi:hypothetical protein
LFWANTVPLIDPRIALRIVLLISAIFSSVLV